MFLINIFIKLLDVKSEWIKLRRYHGMRRSLLLIGKAIEMDSLEMQKIKLLVDSSWFYIH